MKKKEKNQRLCQDLWSEQLEKWSLFTQEDYKRLEDQEKGGIRSIVEQAMFSVATRP